MLDALDQVAPKLRQHQQRPLGQPFFSDPRYDIFPLDERRFQPLEGHVKLLCAVDGGNQELVGGASVSLQLVRAYANVFEYGKNADEANVTQGKRVHQEKHEFLCLTQAIDGSRFESTLLTLSGGLLQDAGVFEIDGRDVQDAEERSKAAQVGALTRRFAEWALCEKILGQFDDICVIKDGTLQTSVAKEAFYAKRAQEKAGKGKILAALSKTSTLLTTTGWSLSDALQMLGPKDSGWAYEWVAQSRHPDHPEANRFHGTESQGVSAAPRQLLDGQAGLKVIQVFKLVCLNRLGRQERLIEALVLLLAQRTVQIVSLARGVAGFLAQGAVSLPDLRHLNALVVAGGGKYLAGIDRIGIHDGADGVIEKQAPAAGQLAARFRQLAPNRTAVNPGRALQHAVDQHLANALQLRRLVQRRVVEQQFRRHHP